MFVWCVVDGLDVNNECLNNYFNFFKLSYWLLELTSSKLASSK